MQQPIPLQPEMLEPILEAQLVSQKQASEESNWLLQGILAQTRENNADELLATQIWENRKNTEEVVTAIKESSDTINFQIEGVELASIKGDTGEKWEDWKTPVKWVDYYTPEEVESIKKEITPVKWKDYFDWQDPTVGKLLSLIEPLIPAPIKGEDWKDWTNWLDADEDRIVKTVMKKMPKPKDWKDWSPDTPEQIKTKLEKLKWEERLDIKAIKWIDKLEKNIDKASKNVTFTQYEVDGKVVANGIKLNLKAGSNITLSWTDSWNGADITISSTSTASWDVVWPTTNTDWYIPQWDWADSKTLKNGIAASSKQDTLVSWTNIKTVNSTSLLWGGDIVTPNTTYTAWTGLQLIWTQFSSTITQATRASLGLDTSDTVTFANLSWNNTGDNATNTQYSWLATSKQDTLVSGTSIKTINSNSLLGSGDIVIGGVYTWNAINDNTSLVSGNAYNLTASAAKTLTLPSTFALWDKILVVWFALTGAWNNSLLKPASGDTIVWVYSSLDVTNSDSIGFGKGAVELTAIEANAKWKITGWFGSWRTTISSKVYYADITWWRADFIENPLVVNYATDTTLPQASYWNKVVTTKWTLLTLTLPDWGSLDLAEWLSYKIIGSGAGGWRIAQNAMDTIRLGSSATTKWTWWYIESTNRYDCVEIVLVSNNGFDDAIWQVISSVGTITVA
jgi:hypothetical protein